jgi:hypothetical protein
MNWISDVIAMLLTVAVSGVALLWGLCVLLMLGRIESMLRALLKPNRLKITFGADEPMPKHNTKTKETP